MSKKIRRQAASGVIDYGDTVVIHQTSETRISAVAFFIPEKSRFSIKIVRYKKPRSSADGWTQDLTLTLEENAVKKIVSHVNESEAVAKQNQTGDFIVVGAGEASLTDHQKSEIVATLTEVLSQPDICVHLLKTEMSSELTAALSATAHYAMTTSESFAAAIGEAESEAPEVKAKQNPKLLAAASDCMGWQELAKTLQKTGGLRPDVTACIRRLVTSVPPKGFEPLPFLQAFSDHFGIPEAECEAIVNDAILGDLVRAWSTLDQPTKDIIRTIAQSRSSLD